MKYELNIFSDKLSTEIKTIVEVSRYKYLSEYVQLLLEVGAVVVVTQIKEDSGSTGV